jgi:hypothetical protein
MRRSTPRLLLTLGAPLILTACATIGPPQPPSLRLPKPPSDLRAARKGEHVILTWTVPGITTDRQTIRTFGTTQICRGLETKLTHCAVVGEIAAGATPRQSFTQSPKPKTTRSYADSLAGQLQTDEPEKFITYAVEVLNAEGRGAGLSNQVKVSMARTLPPPSDFAARVTDLGVVLSWTGEAPASASTPSEHFVYRVYRRLEGSTQTVVAGEVPAKSERSFSHSSFSHSSFTFTDSSIEWQKTYVYRAETVTVIAEENKPKLEIEGDDTPEIKVFANDIFPPAVPVGLQAVSSGPGQKLFVDLVWAPVSSLDLAGYSIYRHEEGTPAIKLNAELVKTPAYRDTEVVSGKRYFYSVSAVDIRGNESMRSDEANELVP